MLTVDRALEILARFQSAAPPPAAEKLAEVMDLIRALDAELARQPANSPDKPFSVTDLLAEPGDEAESPSTRDLGMTGPDYFSDDASPTDLLNQVLNADIEADRSDSAYKWPKRGAIDLWASEQEQQGSATLPSAASPLVNDPSYLPLVANMQDRLQSTLATIRSQADRLYSGGTGHLMPGQSEAMKSIRDHVDSALSLIDAVQQIEALQAGKFPVRLSTFDCVDLVRRASDLMKAAMRAHGHHLNFQPLDNPLHARADFEQSLAILIDLLDNAIRYTPEASTIVVTLDNLGSHILISVVDTGIGLSPSDLSKVGTPFWRALQQPVVQENPGSGLRLHLAQEILKLQGGELIFSGELNKGSTFSFTLPVA